MAGPAGSRSPVSAEKQIGLDPAIELGTLRVVIDAKSGSGDIVKVEAVGVRHLIAGEEHADAIHGQLDGDGVSGMAWLFVKRQHVFLPGDRDADGETTVDCHRFVPEAGKVVVLRMVE